MDLQTRKKISRTMKGKSNFAGHKHTHASKLQIGFSQEGHRNAANHKWTVDKETGQEHRVTGDKPKGSRWGRTNRFTQWIHKEEKEVWDKPSPSKETNHLSSSAKARAKARAKAAGRPYPNMVDNMWAAQHEDTSADRLQGTTSLAMKYLKDTPGQGRKKMTKKIEEAVNPIDVPAYKRKPLTLDTLRKALTKDKMGNDKISHKDVLAKNTRIADSVEMADGNAVNELSKATLSNYASDAALDSTRLGNTLGRAQMDGGISGKEIAKQTGKKIGNRLDGIRRAVKKLQK